MRPLEGLRVLDFTRFLAGPYCTLVLAELGADVVKVEQPHTGDDARRLGPHVNGESYPFAMPNRSKRSVSLDLKNDRGKALALQLAATADVVVENFRPGVAKRLGIGYEALTAVRPDVIYCSISGFGQTGPDSARPGFDIMTQGHIGFLKMTGDSGGRPAKMGVAVNDLAAGATAAYSILGAVIARTKDGVGQYIDVSLVDAGLAWTFWESGAFFGSGEVPTATGTRHRRSAPYQAYRTRDGFVTIGANSDRLWTRLVMDVLGRDDWLDDPRFDSLPSRLQNVDELQREIEAVTMTKPTREWVTLLDMAGVPGGAVLTYDQALRDRQVLAREMVTTLEHPVIGAMRTIAPPTKFSNIDYSVRGPAPWLGQHTVEMLEEIGVCDEEMRELFDDGIVFDAHPELQRVRR